MKIVPNYENEKVQILYGKNLDDAKSVQSKFFKIVIDGYESNLNLTVLVESKQKRVVLF